MGHTIGKCDACQSIATFERVAAYRGYTIWNGDARQIRAILECIGSDSGHAIRNRDVRQVSAAFERGTADELGVFMNCNRGDVFIACFPQV